MPKSLFRRLSKKFFIVSNIIVAVFFVIGCYNKLFFKLGWPLGFLSLASFYFFLLLLLFIVFWLFVKKGWALVSLVAIAICFRPFSHVVPYRFSSSFADVAGAEDLRVMSWNVAQFDLLYYKKKPEVRDDMMALINKYKPDIACFQEMVAADTLVNLNNAYYKRYSFVSVFEYAEKLKYPYYAFSYDFRYDFLDHQHFGTIIFSRYPIINSQRFTFPPYNYNSDFQYADIVKDGDTIRVFNVHLQSLKFTDGTRAFIDDPSLESKQDIKRSRTVISKFKHGFLLRKQQVDRVKKEIDNSPYPVILCGDFNDVPNSYAYQTIGENLQNAFAEKGRGLGRTYTSISPTLRIDNIFVSDSFTVNRFVRLPVKLSDHYPIMADLKKND
jgi:endonuclease/exonuclease/phosphatase family metal-dependent hydrolase